MITSDIYCEFCGEPPPYNYPCSCSVSGSHRARERGTKTFLYKMPDGYESLHYAISEEELIESGGILIETKVW